MEYLLEQMYASADAIAAAVADDSAFDDVAQATGYPIDMRDEHFWVSCSLQAEVVPGDSGLAMFESAPKVGGGITVAQILMTDWAPIRARMLVLWKAFEPLIRADPTLGGTCSRAFIDGVEARETLDDTKKGRLTVFWELDIEQYVGG